MRKISGHVVSTKPITLSRAAKLISRFASVDNGSSDAVSVYLQRAADAFDHLVQFHEKQRSKVRNVENSPDRTGAGNWATKSEKRGFNDADVARDSETVKEKKKKRKSDETELVGKSIGKLKKRRDEDDS